MLIQYNAVAMSESPKYASFLLYRGYNESATNEVQIGLGIFPFSNFVKMSRINALVVHIFILSFLRISEILTDVCTPIHNDLIFDNAQFMHTRLVAQGDSAGF